MLHIHGRSIDDNRRAWRGPLHSASSQARGIEGDVVGVACTAAIASRVAGPDDPPGLGGDWSWVAGLAYAAEHGLQFGERLVWSYGPLGFLNTWYGPRSTTATSRSSWLYAAPIQLLLAATLLFALRRSLHLAARGARAPSCSRSPRTRARRSALAWCVLVVTRARRTTTSATPPRRVPVRARSAHGRRGCSASSTRAWSWSRSPRSRSPPCHAGATRSRSPGPLLAAAAVGWLATGQGLGDGGPTCATARRSGAATRPRWADRIPPRTAGRYPAALALDRARARARLGGVARGVHPRRRWLGCWRCARLHRLRRSRRGSSARTTGTSMAYFGGVLVVFAVLPLRAGAAGRDRGIAAGVSRSRRSRTRRGLAHGQPLCQRNRGRGPGA